MAAASCVLAAACGGGGGGPAGPGPTVTTLPATWGGIWEIRFQFKNCTTGELTMEISAVDTLCAGAQVAREIPIGELGLLPCSAPAVSVSGNTVTASCTTTLMDGACTYTQQVNVTGTVTGDVLTGTGRVTYDVSPDIGDCGMDECIDVVIRGDRTSPDQPGCGPAAR